MQDHKVSHRFSCLIYIETQLSHMREKNFIITMNEFLTGILTMIKGRTFILLCGSVYKLVNNTKTSKQLPSR